MSLPGSTAILAWRVGRVFSAIRLFYGQSVLMNHGQQQVRFPAFAGVNAVSAAEALRRPVAWIVVQEPARAFLHAGLARALEVLSLQGRSEERRVGKECRS